MRRLCFFFFFVARDGRHVCCNITAWRKPPGCVTCPGAPLVRQGRDFQIGSRGLRLDEKWRRRTGLTGKRHGWAGLGWARSGAMMLLEH